MKTLLLSTSDLDGGAARAAFRLMQGLQSVEVDAQMMTQNKIGDDFNVWEPLGNGEKLLAKLRPAIDSTPTRFYRERKRHTPFSPAILSNPIGRVLRQSKPDLIHLHWISQGLLSVEALAGLGAPLVWTMHDMWPFTGGCHYDQDCGAYQASCGNCPALGSSKAYDLSRWVWSRKRKAWKDLKLTIVSPSRWLARCAQESSLFRDSRIEVIPNGIDLTSFRPHPKDLARKILGLPQDKKLILFGAMGSTTDPRKGFQLLRSALQSLGTNGWGARAEVAIFGAGKPKVAMDLGLPTHYLGRLHDDFSLSLVYSAADLFVAPSQQENLANTVMEALACGTPVVAFTIGGMPDLITHTNNGYLAESLNVEDLANGISWVLKDDDNWHRLSKAARIKCESEFDLSKVAARHKTLYSETIMSHIGSIHGQQ